MTIHALAQKLSAWEEKGQHKKFCTVICLLDDPVDIYCHFGGIYNINMVQGVFGPFVHVTFERKPIEV